MVIVGLGNPGLKYANTHHNVGFMLVDELAKDFNTKFKKEKKFEAEVAEFTYKGEKHYLIKPQTYMNNSGLSVQTFMNYYKVGIESLFIIHDDLDMEFGKVRIRRDGSSGGHNGIKSIIQHVGSEDFKRLKFGIKSPHDDVPVIDYVLSALNKSEKEKVDSTKKIIKDIIEDIIDYDIDYAMNKYN